jgi:hypothetical protein
MRHGRSGSNMSFRGRAEHFRFAPTSRHIAVSQQTTFRADFVVQVAGAIGTDRTGNISRHAVVGAPASTPRN